MSIAENFNVLTCRKDGSTVYVNAEAGTGFRYALLVSPIPAGVHEGGGTHIVSVIAPWRTCYPFVLDYPDDRHEDYVGEKLGDPHARASGAMSPPRDIEVLTLALNYAIRVLFGLEQPR